MRVILAAILLCLISCFATAARAHQEQPTFGFDAAAMPPYPIEHNVRVVHHQRSHPHREAASHKKHREPPPKSDKIVPPPHQATASAVSEEWQDGIAAPKPIVITKDRPHRLEGTLRIAGLAFDFVSGGIGASIPYGDYEISPDSQGSWGTRHGALDLTGVDRGDIWDPKLGRHREGIELHGGSYATLGCVAIEQWGRAKRAILSMIDASGHAFLHNWPGAVSITPSRSSGRVIVVLHQGVAKDREVKAERREARHTRRHYAGHRRRHYAHA